MMNLIPGIQSTSAALTAERTRLDIIAQNIAHSNTSHGLDGKPYRRQQVVFEATLNQVQNSTGGAPQLSGPRVSKIIHDTSPFRPQYEPGNPDADRTGTVLYPNVNVYQEMADMVAASRTFEANLAVLKTGKQMTLQTLGLGRR